MFFFQNCEDPERNGRGGTSEAGRGSPARTATARIYQAERGGNCAVAGTLFHLSQYLYVFFFHDHFEIRILFFFGPQEEAKNFITLENLDQRIEEALDNPKNYNFAVDKVGRVVKQTVLQ